MTDDSTVRQRIAGLCRSLARRTGDGRFASAAALLVGKRPGRRAIDDTKALEYARALLSAGMADSAHDACERAAVLYAPAHYLAAVRDRLRRKLSSGASS